MSSPLELIPVTLPLIRGSTIIDIACGRGKWGYLLRVQWWCTKNGTLDAEPKYLVGIDIFKPFLETVKRYHVYDDVVLCDAAMLPFRSSSFDSVLASEVIEHLDKMQGMSLLNEMHRIAKRIEIVTTPNILRRREGLVTPEGFNPYEKHVTRWTVRELRSHGFTIYGVGFLFFSIFSSRLNALLSPISFLIPQLGSHLIAVKKRIPK